MAAHDAATIEVVDQLIKSRRTVRDFVSDPVDDSQLRELIEDAIWAPNHRMTEPAFNAGCLYIGYPSDEPSSRRRDGSAVTTWL